MIQRALSYFLIALLFFLLFPPSATAHPLALDTPGNENWDNTLGNPGLSGFVASLALNGTTLYAGGSFGAAAWNGTEWNSLGNMNGAVYALATAANGDLYAGGAFTEIGSCTECQYSAYLHEANWNSLDGVIDNMVLALAIDSSGKIYAGGDFTNHIATLNNGSWTALGDGLDSTVFSLAVDSNDNVYAGGYFAYNLAEWNGSTWQSFSEANFDGGIYALSVDDVDNLYVGGSFNNPYPYLIRYSSTWSYLDFYSDGSVSALATDHCGGLYVGGGFSTYNSSTASPAIAYWDGMSWSGLGDGLTLESGSPSVQALRYHNGTLYVGGEFDQAGNQSASNIAAWTGRDCTPLSPGVSTYTLYSDNLPVTIEITQPGNISSLRVQRHNQSHPSATTPLQTGYYWQIEALANDGTPATDFSLNLTLTTPPGMTPDDKDKLCRFSNDQWVCAASSHTTNTITLKNVTALSDWTIGDNAGPTAIQLSKFQTVQPNNGIRNVLPLLVISLILSLPALLAKRNKTG